MSIFTRCAAKQVEEMDDNQIFLKSDFSSFLTVQEIREKDQEHLDAMKKKNSKHNPILTVSARGNVRCVKRLVRKGVDLNVRDVRGNTALLLAVQTRHSKVVKTLIEGGCDVNHPNKELNTALLLAVSNGDEKIVEMLLKGGADTGLSNIKGVYPITCAALHRRQNIIENLLQAGASVDVHDRSGSTALMFSSRYGYPDTVELLLKATSDIEAVDRDGNTSLISACTQGRRDNVKVLLRYGADVNHKGNDSTALVEAANKNRLDIVNDLLTAGAKVNAYDSQGNTALLSACRQGNLEMVKVLIKSGSNINCKNNHLHSPLWFAICNSMGSCTPLLTILLDSGVRVEFEFHLAVHFGFKEIVQQFLYHGTFPRLVNVNKMKLRTPPPNGFVSPFTIALTSQRFDIAQSFIDYAYLVDYDLHCLKYDWKLKQFLEKMGKRDSLEMIENMDTPWSLVTLSLRKVSRALEFKSDRKSRVSGTGLPSILQQRLLFLQ